MTTALTASRHPVALSSSVRSACFALAVAFAGLTLAGIDSLAAYSTHDTAALMAQARTSAHA